MTSGEFRRIHFVGVGGAGMSALAAISLAAGLEVSGSDRAWNDIVGDLERKGMTFQLGHEPDLVRGAELLVASSAVPADNPELAWARDQGIPVWKRHQYLPWISRGKRLLAVAGSHGKTTVTALVAHILTVTGRDPTCVVGGVLNQWGTNARYGSGDLFVLEADEYDRTFLSLSPWLGVITSLEMDHPDCYGSFEDLSAAFSEFASQCERVVANDDAPAVMAALEKPAQGRSPVTYGRREGVDWRMLSARPEPAGTGFDFREPSGCIIPGWVPLWGDHAGENALAAVAAAFEAGVPMADSVAALRSFGGVGRRFSVAGPYGGVYLVDDYAHHPTHIRVVISAARQRFPGSRLVVLVQPHTFSRLAALFEKYVDSLGQADLALLLPVYGSRERGDSVGVTMGLARAAGARALASLDEAARVLPGLLREGDVLLNLGAGDNVTLTPRIAEALEVRSAERSGGD